MAKKKNNKKKGGSSAKYSQSGKSIEENEQEIAPETQQVDQQDDHIRNEDTEQETSQNIDKEFEDPVTTVIETNLEENSVKFTERSEVRDEAEVKVSNVDEHPTDAPADIDNKEEEHDIADGKVSTYNSEALKVEIEPQESLTEESQVEKMVEAEKIQPETQQEAQTEEEARTVESNEDPKQREELTEELNDKPKEISDEETNEQPSEHSKEQSKEEPKGKSHITEVEPKEQSDAKEQVPEDNRPEAKIETNESSKQASELRSAHQIKESKEELKRGEKDISPEAEAKKPVEENIPSENEAVEVEEHPKISLLSTSLGPYSLHDLIDNLSIPTNCHISCIETYHSNIYIGTSNGEIFHYEITNNSNSLDLKLVSKKVFHSSRQFPIKKILLLPTISQCVILSSSLLQIFSLPDLSHLNIGKIKDVNSISLDHDHKAKEDSNGVHVVVYTKEKIRVVNVTKTALRLVKDIAYGGVQMGLRRGEFSVVCARPHGSGGSLTGGSGAGEYDLIDLENDGKIPLFPLKTDGDYNENDDKKQKLRPFISPVGLEEFLLTCGTNMKEPGMGLIVNSDGDISRGTIPFEKYPDSLEVDDLLVIAGFDKYDHEEIIKFKEDGKDKDGKVVNEVVIYSIHDQSELQRITFGIDASNKITKEMIHAVKVVKLSSGFKQNHNGLVNLIKLVPLHGKDNERLLKEEAFAQTVSKIESNLIIHSNNSISLLVPKPRLERLLASLYPKFLTVGSNIKSKIGVEELEDEIKSIDASTELGFVEIEFLNTLISLSHLKNHTYSDNVLEYFINGTIDPRILLGIIDEAVIFGNVWIFNGLVPIIKNLKEEYKALVKSGMIKRKELNDIHKFFEKFLKDWLKKEYIENKDIIKSLDLMNLKWSIEHDIDISSVLERVSLYEESLEILKENGKYRSLAEIYLQRGRFEDALKIFRKILDGELPDVNQTDEVKEQTLLLIIDLIYKHFSENDELVEEYGKWLLKKDVNKGMNFFSNLKKDGSTASDELMILEQIDDLGLQLEFVEKILVRLKKDRNLGNLKKSLYKGLLRSK